MQPPKARIEIVQDTYFGTKIEDPYRWLENWQEAEAWNWLQAQSAYTREVLDPLPERQALLTRITELSSASPMLYNFEISGGRYFYFRRDPDENQPKLVVRTDFDAPERVLLDFNGIGGEAHTAIDWYVPSPDGRKLAYGISEGGSEQSVLHILDVDTGLVQPLTIDRTRFGRVSWLADNQTFVYHRTPPWSPDMPVTERRNNSRMYLHLQGNDPDDDVPIWGRGVNESVAIEPADRPFVYIHPGSNWLIGMVVHGVLRDLTLYAAPLSALADPAHCIWTPIADVEDGVAGLEIVGDTLYLRTHKDAPRYKIIATSLPEPDLAKARIVVPESHVVIEQFKVAGDYLLVQDLDAGIARLRRVRLTGDGRPEQVPLPCDGTITEWANEANGPEVLLQITSWTSAPRVYRYHIAEDTMHDSGWRPPSPIDFSEIETYEVRVPSKDGTLIPFSITHKRGLDLDGNNPALLMCYGAYGLSQHPSFRPTMLAWYERGGIFAIAHVRGGGEHGRAWHEAGRKLNKQNTIDDFIACAEYLICQKYTRPERLAGEGTSAGGIPSGMALAQRPDLWAAMVMRVPVLNALRAEFTENGPPNVFELGTVTTEEGFQALAMVDAYSHIRPGVHYPAALITTGLNDPRVAPWQASKMVARLQAATASGRPVLLRVEHQGGHGMGATRRQVDEELADKLAFLLKEFQM